MNANNPLSPVANPISLEKMAYNTIKAAILSFRLAPGETVVETDLARQLGISKTPVREGLGRLEKEGFIVKTPYKGYAVAPISKTDVIDFFEIRAALEGLAARLATANLSEDDIRYARSLAGQQHAAMDSNDIEAASRLNRQFHDLLLERSRNPRLAAMLSNIEEHLQRYRLLSSFQTGRLDKSASEHNRILAAFESHDPAEAEAAARDHILSVLADLKDQDFDELIHRIQLQTAPPF
jgi:DNA-binding GntR family transcriptional regulator